MNNDDGLALDLLLTRRPVYLAYALKEIDRCPRRAAYALRGLSQTFATATTKRNPRTLNQIVYAAVRRVLQSGGEPAADEILSQEFQTAEYVKSPNVPNFTAAKEVIAEAVEAFEKIAEVNRWRYVVAPGRTFENANGALSCAVSIPQHFDPSLGGYVLDGPETFFVELRDRPGTIPAVLYIDRITHGTPADYHARALISTAMLWPGNDWIFELRAKDSPMDPRLPGMIAEANRISVNKLQRSGVGTLELIKGTITRPWNETAPRPGVHCAKCDVADDCWAGPKV